MMSPSLNNRATTKDKMTDPSDPAMHRESAKSVACIRTELGRLNSLLQLSQLRHQRFQIAAPSLLLSKKSKPSNHSRPTRHGKPGPCSLDLPGLFPSPSGLIHTYIYKAMPAWQIVIFQLHSSGLDESTGRIVWYFLGTKCLGGLYLATGKR
ncbi:hypothetical protein B0T13DRAFT_222112 [Neurospora crassa]|nr:hypothetical protein B0T13DRAFT_222112 [Neurospora crassa]